MLSKIRLSKLKHSHKCFDILKDQNYSFYSISLKQNIGFLVNFLNTNGENRQNIGNKVTPNFDIKVDSISMCTQNVRKLYFCR